MNNNNVIYLQAAKTIPVEKLNEFFVFSGFQPLDPSKISAAQVAKALAYIVQSKGLEYYKALINMYEEYSKPSASEFKTDVVDVVMPKSACCGSCKGCNNGKKLNAEGSPEQPENNSEAKDAIAKFIEKNSTVLIIALTAIGIAALLKKN